MGRVTKGVDDGEGKGMITQGEEHFKWPALGLLPCSMHMAGEAWDGRQGGRGLEAGAPLAGREWVECGWQYWEG